MERLDRTRVAAFLRVAIPSLLGASLAVEVLEARRGRLLPVLVPAPGYGGPDAPTDPAAVTVHQDAAVYASLLAPAQRVTHRFRPGFMGYLFVVHGAAHVDPDGDAGELDEGGAAKVVDEPEVSGRARDAGAEFLLAEIRMETGR